jgi:uncharacterized protein (DUF885 family)
MLRGHYRKTLEASTNANHMPARDWFFSFRPLFAATALLAAGVAGCSQSKANADPALAALIQRMGQYEISRTPEEADMAGLSPEAFGRPYTSLLNDRSMAGNERGRTLRLGFLGELEVIDPTALSRDGLRTLESALFVYRAAAAVDRHGHGYVSLGWASPYLINQSDGAYTDLIKILTIIHTVRSRADAEAWLDRLGQMDDVMRDERRRFATDMETGGAPPRAILQRTLDKVHVLTPGNPREHAMILYFTESLAKIPDLPEADIRKMTDRAVEMIGGGIREEYRLLAKDLEKALAKPADDPGVWRIKGGDQYYADALRLYTTTDLTPAQLHEAGEKLVASITTEIEPILLELGQEEGTVGQRLAVLSADPAYLFPDTPEGRVAMIEAIDGQIKWAETRLSRVISVGPKGKVEVRQAPMISKDTAPGAYYKPAALDGSRPATYNLNIRSTLDFPAWTLPTLTYHEAAPGHHLQAGLARERPDQPLLSFAISSPAFSEGWAVYAEDLANELGAYETDRLAKVGYLQSLLFRAARLVADTGIHAERWSREEAIAYLVDTTGMPRATMENEVDRYTIWPGQACAYMSGRETIRRLRTSAQRDLGQAFDLRGFHDAILGPGPRPLPVLEADIDDWVASRRPVPPTE